jgi:hypothetical protein
MSSTQQSIAQPERFTEAEEEKELLGHLFNEIDTDNSGTISHAELTAALAKHDVQKELREILQSLLATGGASAAAQGCIDREAFGKAFESLPRVRGELVSWVRGLRLEEQLARVISRLRRATSSMGSKASRSLMTAIWSPLSMMWLASLLPC